MFKTAQAHSEGKAQRIFAWLAFLLPALVMASIWIPEFNHYHVGTTPLRLQDIEAAQRASDLSVIDEISVYRVLHPWRNIEPPYKVIAEADRIMQGKYLTTSLAEETLRWPFNPDDLNRGSMSWQLKFAAFIAPDRLLKAYALTGNELYFQRATDFLKAWDAYERAAWLPKGLLWNDHAIAERVYVLVDFWRIYRKHSQYDVETAKTLLTMLDRCAKLLAKSSHFNFATNHGVMQNLALIHLALAIPQFPSAREYEAVGHARIIRQLGFYLSPEGPVLEHSASYHRFGLALVGMFTRYMALNKQTMPHDWQQQYDKSANFFALLRRPDGTLPLVGDSIAEANSNTLPVFSESPPDFNKPLGIRDNWKPQRAFSVYPLSGYGIAWNGLREWPDTQQMSQLLITWGRFPGHGHQRAQELSVLFWASGQTWWTNSGYWAYGHPARQAAESWQGGGAPHASGESPSNARSVVMRGYGTAGESFVIDLERSTEDGLRIRRQIVQATSSLWLTLDQTEDTAGRTVNTTWTTYPNVTLEPGSNPNTFRLSTRSSDTQLDVSVLGAPDIGVSIRHGDTLPFAGWVYLNDRATATKALMVTHKKHRDWSAMIWSLGKAGEKITKPMTSVDWHSADRWNAHVDAASGPVKIVREGNVVRVGEATLELKPAMETSPEKLALRQAFVNLDIEFPKFRDLRHYRAKISYLLILALAIQAAAYLAVRLRFPRFSLLIAGASTMSWVSGAIWLHTVYFKT